MRNIVLYILFFLSFDSFSQQNNILLYDEKGYLKVDTSFRISELQLNSFQESEQEIISSISNNIIGSLPTNRNELCNFDRDFYGEFYLSFTIENSSNIKVEFEKIYRPIVQTQIKDIKLLLERAIDKYFTNNEINLVEGKYFLPIFFNQAKPKRDTTIYFCSYEFNSILITYNSLSADYYDYTKKYLAVNLDEFQKIRTHLDSTILSKIKINNEISCCEIRLGRSDRLPRMPIKKKNRIFKPDIYEIDKKCYDEVKYSVGLIPEVFDTICSKKGFYKYRWNLFYYGIALKNNKIIVINTKELFFDLLGEIENIEEAQLFLKLKGYNCKYGRKLSEKKFEFLVSKNNSMFSVILNSKKEIEEKRLGKL